VLAIVDAIEIPYKWAMLGREPLPHWSVGRVSLIGDACHPTLPFLAQGANMALEDGLVLARAAMHHSANYRSAMLLGTARAVEEPAEKLAALEAIVEHIVPGRWAEARAPSENELKATAVLALPIDEASAKLRSGPPEDDEPDYELAIWAGVIPFSSEPSWPLADARLSAGVPVPQTVAGYRRGGSPRPRR